MVQKALADDRKLVEASQKLHRQALEELSGGLVEVERLQAGLGETLADRNEGGGADVAGGGDQAGQRGRMEGAPRGAAGVVRLAGLRVSRRSNCPA